MKTMMIGGLTEVIRLKVSVTNTDICKGLYINMINRVYRAAVGAFIFNKEEELLLILKHDYVNRWNIVKGGIDFNGEDELGALNREIKEELGTDNFQIIEKSIIPTVYVRPDFKWSNIETNEHVGQAQTNYWVYIDKKEHFKIPNEEIQDYKWIKITNNNIQSYFNIDIFDGTYKEFLLLEWNSKKIDLFKKIQ